MIDTKQKLVEFMRDNPGIIVCRSTEEVNEMLRLIEQTNNPAYSNAYKYVGDDSFVYFRLDARAYEEYLCYGSHEYVAEQFPRENWFEFREIVSYKPVSFRIQRFHVRFNCKTCIINKLYGGNNINVHSRILR